MDRFYRKKQKPPGTAKVRRRFPIPVWNCPFFFKTQRRWKNDACCDNLEIDSGHLDDDNHARRLSIDHTSPLQDSCRSLSGACSPDSCSPCNLDHAHGFASDEAHHVDNRVSIMPRSLCRPVSFYQKPGASTSCPCLECSPSTVQEQEHPGMPPSSKSMPAMIHQSNSDSTLQARIAAIRIQQQYVGDNHPDVIFALSSLAKVQEKRGNHLEAAAIWKESQLRMTLAKYASSHPLTNHLATETSHHGVLPTEISYCHQI